MDHNQKMNQNNMRKSTRKYLKKRLQKQYKRRKSFGLLLYKNIKRNLSQYFQSIFEKDALSIILFFTIRLGIILVVLAFLTIFSFIFIRGFHYITPSLFAWEYNSENVSMMPAIINTLFLIVCALCFSIPIAIFGAVFLNEYPHKNNYFIASITLATETLAGIPSIVYGLFGYLAFVLYFQMGLSFLSGALTLSIMILPLIFKTAQESLKAVDKSLREASFALGAGKLRTIFAVVLPASASGILAGVILGIGKIVGESAALLYTAGNIAKIAGLFDSGRTLSVHMYEISREGLHINEAYSTAMVLILIVLVINITAHYISNKITRV